MSTIVGRGIAAGGGGGELNVFVQETQPTAQNGLWVKKAKGDVSKVLIKNDYYLSDGVGANLPGDAASVMGTNYSSCAAVKIGNKIYILPLGVTSAVGFIYDIDTGVFTKYSSSVQFANTTLSAGGWCVYDGKIYVVSSDYRNGNRIVEVYDPVSNSVSSVANIGTSPSQGETYGMWVSDEYIFLAGGSVYDAKWYDRPVLYDRSTEVATVITNTQHLSNARGAGYVFKHDTKLYFVGYCVLSYSYDLQTGQFEYIDKQLNPLYTPSTGAFSPNTFFYALGKLYLIGVQFGPSTYSQYGKKRDVLVYDLVSEQITLLENVISEDAARSFHYFGGIDFQGTLQAGFYGGYVQNSASASKVYQYKIMVFNIKTNEFQNGTVVCQPSVKENVTEMYSDKLSTLDFGVSEVYYQSVDGFFKQPAAIIKNGVVTNIGEVTPTPTPTLEGTWVLNANLTAPAVSQVISGTMNTSQGDASLYSLQYVNDRLNFYNSQSSIYSNYDFSYNSWTNRVISITFPSGATASDDFITWLAANATKQ